MNLSLSGKLALLTGAFKGIRRALAKMLLEEGSDLIMVARDERSLRREADETDRTTGIAARIVAASCRGKLLNLDTEKLCPGRRDTWRSCERRLKELRGIVEAQRHQNKADAGDRLKDLCRYLDDLYDEKSEFTVTAWACAKEFNAEMIVRLAMEVARPLN